VAAKMSRLSACRSALLPLRATFAHPRASTTRTLSPAMQPGGVLRLGAPRCPVEFVGGGRRVSSGVPERAGAGLRGIPAMVRGAPAMAWGAPAMAKNKIVGWLTDLKGAFTMDMAPEQDKVWFSFKDATNLDTWQTASDSDFGGQSTCVLELTGRGTARFWGNLAVGRTAPSAAVDEENQMKRHGFQRWAMRFWQKDKMKVARSGFAAFAVKSGTLQSNINEWNVIRLRIKTDGRTYIANLRNAANGNGDVHQVVVVCPKGEWVDYRIKISDFILTSRGLINTDKVRVNLREVKTFGFSMMDLENGPFDFEIESAILEHDPSVDSDGFL